jgi:hypothetical protein
MKNSKNWDMVRHSFGVRGIAKDMTNRMAIKKLSARKVTKDEIDCGQEARHPFDSPTPRVTIAVDNGQVAETFRKPTAKRIIHHRLLRILQIEF